MVQSVELLLDDAADREIRSQWACLLDAGLPSQARHTGASNRPHVTLTAHAWLPADLDDVLAAAVGPLPLPLVLGGLLTFEGRRRGRTHWVLARSVLRSPALLALQQGVAAALEAQGAPAPLGDHLRPGRWTPHVTLAQRLSDDELTLARTLLAEDHRPASAVTARRWDGDRRVTWDLSTP